jgi:branched-subunit amino acid ABC-type transport system permease component
VAEWQDRRRLAEGAGERRFPVPDAGEIDVDRPVEIVNSLISGLLFGGILALTALVLSLVLGVMQIVNLAHGELLVGGAYLALALAALAYPVQRLLIEPVAGKGAEIAMGALVGATTVTAMSEALADYPQMNLALTGLLLIVIVRLAPSGVCGLAQKALAATRRLRAPSDRAAPLASEKRHVRA